MEIAVSDTQNDNFAKRAKEQTRTIKTEEDYTYRASLFVKRYRKARKQSSGTPINSLAFVDWLLTLQSKYKPATWRQYKSAIIAALQFPDFKDLLYDENAFTLLSEADPHNCKPGHKGETSAKKIKKLPLDDFRKLLDCLKNRGGQWSKAVSAWLQAGVWTGLRPTEWEGVRFETEDGYLLVTDWSPGVPPKRNPIPPHSSPDERRIYKLTVKNAKATNGRANGKYRELCLDLTEREVKIIAGHIRASNTYAALPELGFEKYYKASVRCLGYTCKMIWPKGNKHYTLYSARHQFAANQKAAGKSKEEIAAMMGHSDISTAGRHYAKRRSGWGFNNDQQAKLDVADINSRNIPGL